MVHRNRQIAYASAILMLGLVGCTAEATPTPTEQDGTQAATPTTTATRPTINVQLNPDAVTEGEADKVWILANCPLPSGGPAHTGRATSEAFVVAVTLTPTTGGPAATASPGLPWVRGEADVSRLTKPGRYAVDVKCEGTNDTGRATLRVRREASEQPPGDGTESPVRPTRIGAGGGGAYGREVDEGSGFPFGPAGVLLGLAVAGGVGLAIRRRRT